MSVEDTIFALATGAGRSGVAIIRISGPRSHTVLAELTNIALPKDRVASVRKLVSKTEILDESLVLKFSNPNSFTGEDMVELHLHGGEAVIEGVSRALFDQGLRQAEPGEFTKRAFSNGRMDLTEAEGLADLIDAKSETQKRQALKQMGGGLRDRYEGWRNQIIEILSQIEGELDFVDEGDVPNDLAIRAAPRLELLAGELRKSLLEGHKGERIRHGLEVVVIGAPNAGKSSLINALGGRSAAIVSSVAGTTRDIIEVHIEVGGLPVRLSDTAGLRDTDNDVEAEGVRRALKRAEISDLRIGVVDLTQQHQIRDILPRLGAGDLLVLNKSDAVSAATVETFESVSRETFGPDSIFVMSLKRTQKTEQGQGVAALESAIGARINTLYSVGETSGLTRARHRECVERTLVAVETANNSLSRSPEVAGAELVSALRTLQELAGETDIEAVLDKVFSSFCIGK